MSPNLHSIRFLRCLRTENRYATKRYCRKLLLHHPYAQLSSKFSAVRRCNPYTSFEKNCKLISLNCQSQPPVSKASISSRVFTNKKKRKQWARQRKLQVAISRTDVSRGAVCTRWCNDGKQHGSACLLIAGVMKKRSQLLRVSFSITSPSCCTVRVAREALSLRLTSPRLAHTDIHVHDDTVHTQGVSCTSLRRCDRVNLDVGVGDAPRRETTRA